MIPETLSIEEFNKQTDWLKTSRAEEYISLSFFSIHQISGKQFSRVLVGSRNLEYPWISSVLGRDHKMTSRFATVSKNEILAVNEAAAPTNTKKETKFDLLVFTGW